METNKIYNEDCLEGLRKLPDECVDCCVTSPPYWGLRDYGENGQLGQEKHFSKFVERLVAIFSEVQRVLKPTGTCFVNLGDTYGTVSGNMGCNSTIEPKWPAANKAKGLKQQNVNMHKCALMIPERFALAMIDKGWILRNQIIWHKPNQMPQSVKDRFTVDFEKVFFFVKQKKYYFEQQLEPHKEISLNRWGNGGEDTDNTKYSKDKPDTGVGNLRNGSNPLNDEGRNRRCVWSMNTKPFSDAHFACYPEKLIEIPIKAGCPADGLVLDPFMGSGTTACVARKLGRNYIGYELNADYIEIAEKRIYNELGMFS